MIYPREKPLDFDELESHTPAAYHCQVCGEYCLTTTILKYKGDEEFAEIGSDCCEAPVIPYPSVKEFS